MNIQISVVEMMSAIRKLNPAFDDVICINDELYKECALEKLADICQQSSPGNVASAYRIFADHARDTEVLSADQARFLGLILAHNDAFHRWLYSVT